MGVLYRPTHAVSCRIIIQQSDPCGAGIDGPRAVTSWAARESGGFYPPHRATRALAGYGPSVATETEFFLWNFLQKKFSIDFFVRFFSKFLIAFSIQIITTKICLENSKVTETFLKSLKVMNLFNS
jgi:hypothetical protein